MAFAAAVQFGAFAEPVVSDVVAKQRYPWNELVDITCSLSGFDETTKTHEFVVAAVIPDSTNDSPVSHFWVMRDGLKSTNYEVNSNGTYHLIWDAKADLGEVVYSNIVVRVTVTRALEKVQLWKGGPSWATTNIGAEEPWEYGYSFMWGDIVGYKFENNAWVASDGSSFNFSFSGAPTYGKSVATLKSEGWITTSGALAPEHDAAHVQWGGIWRMPTSLDIDYLNSMCDWIWTTTNGVPGYIVRGRGDYASNSIFLPCAGYGKGASHYSAKSDGYYWSSIPYSSLYSGDNYQSLNLRFGSGYRRTTYDYYHDNDYYRYLGQSIRPVQGLNNPIGFYIDGTDSMPFMLDTMVERTVASSIIVQWDASWIGSNADATVVITDNGVEIVREIGFGEYELTSANSGRHELTYKTLIDGNEQEEAYTAVLFKDWKYAVDEAGGAIIMGTSSTSGELEIPSEIDGYAVTGIGENAFANNGKITSVIIPESVTSIGDHAFASCYSLTGVTIPDSVTSIGSYAFAWCDGITSVTIPNSVTSIGEEVFGGFHLQEVTISQSLCDGSVSLYNVLYGSSTSIYDKLKTINIVGEVSCIGNRAFSGLSAVEQITIPDGVTSIGYGAFAGCSSLTNMIIPDGVTCIGDYAFGGCSGLVYVELPDSVETVGNMAFSWCPRLADENGFVIIHETLYGYYGNSRTIDLENLEISSYVFDGSAFDSVTLSNCNIRAYSFYHANIDELNIFYSGCYDIAQCAFADCNPINTVRLICTGDHDNLQVYDDWPMGGGYPVFYTYNIQSVSVPESVCTSASLMQEMWSGSCIRNLEVNDGVGSIIDGVFDSLEYLERVSIPNSVESIGDSAFARCYLLMDISVDEGNMVYKSQNGLLLTKDGTTLLAAVNGDVVIPDSVLTISANAFTHCSNVKSVTMPLRFKGGSYGFSTANITYTCDYDVVFHANGGTGEMLNQSRSYGDGAALNANTFTKEGYSFAGWVLSDDGEIAYVDGYVGDMIDEAVDAIDLYAKWAINQYTATFDANGGVGSCNATQDYGTKLSAPTVTRVGYDFSGWIPEVPSTMPAEDMSYTAQWVPKKYTITFDANGGSGGWSEERDYDSEIVAPIVTRTGYEFAGWSPEVAAKVPDEGVTYVAQWTPKKYRVTFDANGGEGGWSEMRDYDSEIVAPVVTRTGYSFNGWNHAVSNTVPNADVEYVAQWVAKSYTVSFDANGGDVMGATKTVTYDSAYGELPVPTKTGYSLGAWTLGGNIVNAESIVNVPADHVLTANWVANNYQVSFDCNGGNCDVGSASIVYNTAIGELPVPTKDGAEFIGWWTETDAGDRIDESLVITADMTIYAHWLYEVAMPVIMPGDGASFRRDTCHVSISCETEGATIYYSAQGKTPKHNDNYLYHGEFEINDTAVVKAIAVFGALKSGCVTATITKEVITLEEVLDVGDKVDILTSDQHPWLPKVDDNAKVGDASAKSGIIGDNGSSWMAAQFVGAGTVTFWNRVSCEDDYDGATWDRLMVYTNDVEIAHWRMDGKTDWVQRRLSFTGGANVIKWVYYKDEDGGDGEDCAWVDGIVWTPDSEPDEPEPQVAPLVTFDDSKMEAPVVDEESGKRTIEPKSGETLDESDVAKVKMTASDDVTDITEAYHIELVDGTIEITLATPKVEEVEENKRDEDDPSGMLANVEPEQIEEQPEPKEGEEVGALPVKTYPGLYYQASWGDDLNSLTTGEKVQATGDSLYLGVIKQKGDKGFYKLSVSEK